jgi:hypothetical protein
MSFHTTSTLTALHPKSDGYFPFFPKNYELNQDFKFSSDSFKLTFQRLPHLMASGLFIMVFERFQNYFHLEN